jgi:hypothetical protein
MLGHLYDLNFVLAGCRQGVKRSMMVLTLRQDSGNPKLGSQENISKKSKFNKSFFIFIFLLPLRSLPRVGLWRHFLVGWRSSPEAAKD